MNKVSLSTLDDTPPPKKRRIRPPGFESSFRDANPSSSTASRRAYTIQSDFSAASHEFISMFGNRGHERETPVRGLKPPRPVLDEYPSEVYLEGNDGNSSPHNLRSRRNRRVSASFSEFTSTFNITPRPSTLKLHCELLPCKIAHPPCHTSDLLPTNAVQSNSVVSASISPRTSMRVLKHPSLRDPVENNYLSENPSLLSRKVSHLHSVTSAETDKVKLSSMTSHRTCFTVPISNPASPNLIPIENNRNLIPIFPPILAPELINGSEKAGMAIPITVSHAERAKILANSVRVSRFNHPTNTEFSELSRGFELSPQKHDRAHSKKFVRGSLAERAQHLLLRSTTNFSLWQAALVKQLQDAKHTKEDIRLRISSIISFTKTTTRSFSDGYPRTAVAKCTKVPQGTPGENESLPQERTVVFLFTDHEKVSSAVDFQEGKEVCVWRPWQEIEPSGVFDQLHSPALAPQMRSSTKLPNANRKAALLCSRFLVLA